MLNLKRTLSLPVALLCVCLIPGCGKAGPPLAATSGIIKYQGQPVEGADVVFMSTEKFEERTWPASAKTDASGKYVLETPGVGHGALIGKHTVTITKRGPSPGAIPGSPAVGNETKPEMQAYMQPGPPLIPKKYFSPVTSGLEADVLSGSNTFDFELKD